MSESKQNVPKLRFPGFTDPWEQRKLGEVADSLVGYPFESKHFVSSGYLLVRGMNVKRGYLDDSVELAEYWPTAQGVEDYLLEDGDIVIQMDGALIGKSYARVTSANLPALLVQRVTRIRSKNNSLDFIYQSIQRNFLPYINKSKTETAVPHLSLDDIKGLDVCMPVLAEQRQIGSYFQQLDSLITLHQRKLEHLKLQKRGLLQKMFPRDGADRPEIRFPGFTDPWEQRKLGEVAEDTFGGGTPNTSISKNWSGTIPWIQSSDIIEGKILDVEARKTITEEGLNSSAAKLVPEVSIAIVTRVGVGKLALVQHEYATSQDFLSLSNLNINPLFAVYCCYKKLQSEQNVVQGTSIKGMTKKELLSKAISVPAHYAEQQQIGTFFQQVDKLITLHQRELEHLQDQKKALLQQMFV